ncbi:hypothetical protein GGI23_001148 [Coemansia sp. RSA 2559]|nr:hypothetical protein GGI23_001148 [Coemansia sp. RSA 2559]KAJ2865008.1 hypothetical protein GGI22_001600 [Coemansia erecta]
MSSRAVRRLLKESGYDDLAETAAMVESRAKAPADEDGNDALVESKQKQNMFDLLMGGGDDAGQQEHSSSDEAEEGSKIPEATKMQETFATTAGSKGRRATKGVGGGKRKGASGKKGQRGKAKQKAVDDLEMGELQKHLDKMQEQDATSGGSNSKGEATATAAAAAGQQQSKELLVADVKHLDAEAEIRRLFGSAAVASANDNNVRIGGRKVPRHMLPKRLTLTRPKLTWPPLQHGPGVSVEEIDVSKADAATRQLVQEDVTGGRWFAVEHSERFRTVQVGFLEAVVRNDADAIAGIVYHHPYHVDALLQLSEIIKQTGGDFGEAGALVERALYAFEQGFAPRLNIAAGTARVDFRRIESRSLFLALFRHMQFLARRGCWRTAFEVNKVLLSLDPAHDPFGALVTLDFHALKAAQYEYVERFASQWAWAPVQMMPGWGFSRALAALMLERRELKRAPQQQQHGRRSMELLVDAILTFPTAVPVLWAKANIDVDARVAAHPYFADPHVPREDSAMTHMQLLVQLFVERSGALYRVPEVTHWLQEGLQHALARISESNGGPAAFAARKERVQSAMCSYVMPENVSRHVLVADMDALKAGLPEHIRSAESYAFDPLPPADNIDPYSDFVGGMMNPSHLMMPGAFVDGAAAAAAAALAGEGEDDANILQRLLGLIRGRLGDVVLEDPGTSDEDGDDSGSNDEDGGSGDEETAAPSGSSGNQA